MLTWACRLREANFILFFFTYSYLEMLKTYTNSLSSLIFLSVCHFVLIFFNHNQIWWRAHKHKFIVLFYWNVFLKIFEFGLIKIESWSGVTTTFIIFDLVHTEAIPQISSHKIVACQDSYIGYHLVIWSHLILEGFSFSDQTESLW